MRYILIKTNTNRYCFIDTKDKLSTYYYPSLRYALRKPEETIFINNNKSGTIMKVIHGCAPGDVKVLLKSDEIPTKDKYPELFI